MHGEQLALNEIRLRRLAQPDGDVGLAHGKVEFFLGGEQRDADVRIELEEFAEPRRQPVNADARRRGDAQIAIRSLAAVGQFRPRRFKLHEYVVRGAIQQFALLGEDQPARVTVKQRDGELLLQRAHLARDGRL